MMKDMSLEELEYGMKLVIESDAVDLIGKMAITNTWNELLRRFEDLKCCGNCGGGYTTSEDRHFCARYLKLTKASCYCSSWQSDGLTRAERGGMTPEDKAIIAEYMGWFNHIYFYKYDEPIYFQEGVAGDIVFDLNDAGLCVEKMNDDGGCEWEHFYQQSMSDFAVMKCKGISQQEFVAWIFNPDNFFQAMAAWLRSKK